MDQITKSYLVAWNLILETLDNVLLLGQGFLRSGDQLLQGVVGQLHLVDLLAKLLKFCLRF